MIAFKYRGITSFERDLDSLIKNQIFAPLFVDLNDPYEAIYNDELTGFVNFLGKTFKKDTSKVRENYEILKSYKSKVGIYALSSNYNNELLWTHYAQSHKGFCIEYDVDKLQDKYSAPKTVTEIIVKYKSKPQSTNVFDIGKDKLLEKHFSTKSTAWKYEDEVRLLFDNSGFKNYHPSALKGIYFGTNMLQKNKEKMISLLDSRDVKFYQIYQIAKSYKFERRFICENKRKLSKLLDNNLYEILKTRHSHDIENFCILYKGEKLDKASIKDFIDNFVEYYMTKRWNIELFDDKCILPLLDKYPPFSKKEYVKFADHLITIISSDSPDDIDWYPHQDSYYKSCGGKNWKKERYE